MRTKSGDGRGGEKTDWNYQCGVFEYLGVLDRYSNRLNLLGWTSIVELGSLLTRLNIQTWDHFSQSHIVQII